MIANSLTRLLCHIVGIVAYNRFIHRRNVMLHTNILRINCHCRTRIGALNNLVWLAMSHFFLYLYVKGGIGDVRRIGVDNHNIRSRNLLVNLVHSILGPDYFFLRHWHAPFQRVGGKLDWLRKHANHIEISTIHITMTITVNMVYAWA